MNWHGSLLDHVLQVPGITFGFLTKHGSLTLNLPLFYQQLTPTGKMVVNIFHLKVLQNVADVL